MTFAVSLPRLRKSRHFYRWRSRLQRWRRAWRYARNTLTADDADWLLHDAQHAAKCYALECLTAESVLALAEDRYGEHPEFRRLADEACARVWDKWGSAGNEADAAQDWAMDLFAEYAENDGIELVDRW